MIVFPRHDIDPKKKDDKWLLQFAKAAWEDSRSFKNLNFYHNRDRLKELRDYSNGIQNNNQYKSSIEPDDANGESFVPLDYTIVPFIPKFKKIAVNKINKISHNIVATAIDSLARDDEEKYFAEQKAKITILEQLGDIPGIEQMIGLEDDDPHSIEELKIKKEFSYKHQAAIEAEQGIDLVFSNNKYNEIQALVTNDLFDWGVGGVKEYFDPNGVIKIRHVNCKYFLCSYSERPDFTDCRYMGEVVPTTIENVRRESGFSEEVMEEIYEKVRKNRHTGDNYYIAGSKSYDDYRVEVVDFEFKSVNDLVTVDRINNKGNKEKRIARYSSKDKPGKKHKRTSYEVIYKCKWIVGTDHVYSTGLMTNMKRKKNSLTETSFSFHMRAPMQEEMRFFGVTEAMIPVADQIQFAWLKLQNLILNIIPPGIAFDLDALENVNLGAAGQLWKPLKVMDLYRQRGDIAYRGTDKNGEPIMNGGVPITPIRNQVMGEVNNLVGLINAFLNMLRDNIGFNEITDGSTPDPRTLNGVANLAYQSTTNALGHIIDAKKSINESLADGVVLRMQDAFADGSHRGYMVALGINTQRFWKAQADISIHELSVKLEDKPDDEMIARVNARIDLAIQTGQITIADAEFLETIDNIKERSAVLAYRVKKKTEEDRAFASQQIQENGQVQQQSAVVSEEAKQRTLQMEHQFKMEQIQLEKTLEGQIEQIKQQGRLTEANVREEGRITAKEIENVGNMNVKSMENLQKQ